MCGVAGALGLDPAIARPAVERMRDALVHRGPDGLGLEVIAGPRGAPPAVLAHTRLSIVDLSRAGHQPMSADPARADAPWISYNGEAYNAPELRETLRARGHAFRGTSDTEVLLRGYQEWGVGLYERVRGMFAWCVVDPARRQVWLARDRVGIKPLYFTRPAQGGLLFASEVRALLAAGEDLVPRRLNPQALEGFLAQGAVMGEASLIAGVRALPPGTSLVLDWEGRPEREEQHWSVPFRPRGEKLKLKPLAPERRKRKRAPRREVAIERLAHVLREGVSQHLRADVDVGLFLSGGVDSAALATVIREERELHTISLGFDVPELDESSTAAKVASVLGTQHHARRLRGDDALEHVDDVLAAVDQPTVDGFNTWFVSREAARQGLKVVLSGVGGDELFAGYASFRDVPRARRLARLLGPSRRALELARPLSKLLGGRGALKLAELGRRPLEPLELYLLRRELLLPSERLALFPAGEARGVPAETLTPLRRSSRKLDAVAQISSFELSLYLRYMLLRDADAFSMAHSLELRVPLLDHPLIEEVAPLPGRWKLGALSPSRRPKPLLVAAVGPQIPKAALGPKRGFTFPWEAWFRGPLQERARAALAARDVWTSLGIDADAAESLGERFARKDPAVPALSLLALVVLEDYARRHGLRA